MQVSTDMIKKYMLAALRNCSINDFGIQFITVYLINNMKRYILPRCFNFVGVLLVLINLMRLMKEYFHFRPSLFLFDTHYKVKI